jgi:hypothetical protein
MVSGDATNSSAQLIGIIRFGIYRGGRSAASRRRMRNCAVASAAIWGCLEAVKFN